VRDPLPLHVWLSPKRLRAQLQQAEERARRAEDALLCDACGGTGEPISGRPCGCGGTGSALDMLCYVRLRVFELEREARAAEEQRGELLRALEDCIAGMECEVRDDGSGQWVSIRPAGRFRDALHDAKRAIANAQAATRDAIQPPRRDDDPVHEEAKP
jgi:hypothetical protein